jgi:crotonobetainyl-CoA:carnitine CoA-transferase CaiB-like acyl-CoA transferase
MFGIVSTPEDIAKSPQLEFRHWLQDVRHNETGETLRYPGPPYRLSETPWSIRRRPPLPGEHNAEVYGGLGVPVSELSALQAKGVV